jgi:hypothetical protein
MSHTQVQWARGATAAVAAYTGPQGELVLNTDDWSLQAQDGSTAGGWVTRPRLNVRVSAATGSQSVAITDDLIVWGAASPATFTLPASPRVGEVHIFKNQSSPASNLTVAGNTGQTIDGAASVVIGTTNAALKVVWIGGSQWMIIP